MYPPTYYNLNQVSSINTKLIYTKCYKAQIWHLNSLHEITGAEENTCVLISQGCQGVFTWSFICLSEYLVEVTGTTLSVSPLYYQTNVDAEYHHVQETQNIYCLNSGISGNNMDVFMLCYFVIT